MGGDDAHSAHAHGKPKARVLLGDQEREALAQKLLAFSGPDGTFLQKVGSCIDRHHVRRPEVAVTYKDLTVTTEALIGAASIPTVGNVALSFIKTLFGLQHGVEVQDVKILDGVNGILKPGRLTLLLGPPSCGKSTFLKVLSGRLEQSRELKVSGSIQYNGTNLDEFCVQRTAAHVDQLDNHTPYLSVLETLLYAFKCQAGLHGLDFNLPEEILKADLRAKGMQGEAAHAANGKSAPAATAESQTAEASRFEEVLAQTWGTGVKVEVMLKLLGLFHCRNTLIGDAMVRGISGGERKRVSTAEMLVSPRNVMFLDEISTGLDSATIYSVISWLSQSVHALQQTCLISLLQPQPETFQLFDDVVLIASGRVFYHGPVTDVLPFFSSLGFECPPRKDVSSFLLEVTTPAGQVRYASAELRAAKQLPLVDDAKLDVAVVPRALVVTLDEMVKQFWEVNEHGLQMKKDMSVPIDPAACHPNALVHTQYALSPLEAIAVCTKRQMTLMLRDRILLRGRIMQTIVISLIAGSLFYQLSISLAGARSLFGACFMGVLFLSFGGFPQLPYTIEMKKVWYKHRDNYFIPAYAQGIAISLVQMPVTLIEVSIFSLVFYFMIGYYENVSYFFVFFCVAAGTSLSLSSLFRLIGFMSPNMIIANASGGFCILLLIITSGFVIVRTSIPPWMIWGYYVSPFAYALRALVINEFTSPKWQDLPSPGDPTTSLGDAALESFSFFRNRDWIWGGVAYLYGLYIILTLLSIVSLAYQSPQSPRAQLPDEKQIEEARKKADEQRKKLMMERIKSARKIEAERLAAHVDPNRDMEVGDATVTGNVTIVAVPPLGNTPSAKRNMLRNNSKANGQDFGVMDIASSLPFQKVTLVFKAIMYYVPNPAYSRGAAKAAAKKGAELPERLTLLNNVTGYAEPGVLSALMGGSGAGKTTLMDVIAGRKTIGEIEGEIFVNGYPKEQRSWSRVMGYCEQNDIHSPAQTVREALLTSARLRLPESVKDEQVTAYVDEVLDIVDMMDIMYNLVGSAGVSGLSVEQRKRLTIGVELVSNPSVIFMDEPTSGLDARAAATVMRAVRNVARNGRTVVVTIHQPSIEIFEAFDMLLLIQRGGRITYFGPLGDQSSALIEYLCRVPGTPGLPAGYNPATWMLEVTGGSMATQVQAVDCDWPGVYKESKLYRDNMQYADELVERDAKLHHPLVVQTEYALPFYSQYTILLGKFTVMFWRSPGYNFTRLFMTLLISLLYGATYYQSGQIDNPSNLANVQNIVGIMFSSSNMLGMTNLMSAMAIIGYERITFYRERGASMYDAFAYGFAIAVVEVPYLFVQSIFFVIIMYWMVSFRATAEAFFLYFILFFETIAFYTIFGQFLVYITPNAGVAQVIGATSNFMFNLFNGFVITYPAMPKGWRWMNRFSPPTWILYGLGVSQLGDSNNIMNTPTDHPGQILTVSQFMEAYFGYQYYMRWWCVLIMAAYILFVRVTSILALKYWNFLRR